MTNTTPTPTPSPTPAEADGVVERLIESRQMLAQIPTRPFDSGSLSQVDHTHLNEAIKDLADAISLIRTLSASLQSAEARAERAEADDVRAALMDSQYLAGVQAGFNAAQHDDPNAALEAIHASRAGYLKPITDRRRALASHNAKEEKGDA